MTLRGGARGVDPSVEERSLAILVMVRLKAFRTFLKSFLVLLTFLVDGEGDARRFCRGRKPLGREMVCMCNSLVGSLN